MDFVDLNSRMEENILGEERRDPYGSRGSKYVLLLEKQANSWVEILMDLVDLNYTT